MPENHECLNSFLPSHWNRHVKSALLHVISLARLACVHTWAWAAGSLDTCIGQEVVVDNTRGHLSLAMQTPDGDPGRSLRNTQILRPLVRIENPKQQVKAFEEVVAHRS